MNADGKLVIDRFEGDFAVCETGERRMVNIERSRLPDNAREGDVIRLDGESYKLDPGETEKRKREMDALTDDLWK